MMKKIIPPLGLAPAVGAVEAICAAPQLYRSGICAPPHFIINLPAGNGQTCLMRYISRMYAAHGIRRFGGRERYLEYRPDGTLAQLAELQADIRSAAGGTNDYEGLIGFDIAALGAYVNAGQMPQFIGAFRRLSSHATLVFFTPAQPDANMRRLADKLENALEDARLLQLAPYTAAELVQIERRFLADVGVETEDTPQLAALLQQAVEQYAVADIPQLRRLHRRLVQCIEFADDKPQLKAAALQKLPPAAEAKLEVK